MQEYTPSYQRLIEELNKLPGIGPKSAEKLASYLIRLDYDDFNEFIDTLNQAKQKVKRCKICYNLTEDEICEICNSVTRDVNILCVIEETKDLVAIEKTGIYNGIYHVLHGVLKPMENINAENIKLIELIERIKSGNFKELILATNLTYDGELTAMYIYREIKDLGLKITRLASGLPMGSDIEFADQITLRNAFKGRDLVKILEDRN
jgi:recombination protein RecR